MRTLLAPHVTIVAILHDLTLACDYADTVCVMAEGSLVRDDEPSYTLYRMRFTDEAGTTRETVGVLGALEVVDEGAGGVLPC